MKLDPQRIKTGGGGGQQQFLKRTLFQHLALSLFAGRYVFSQSRDTCVGCYGGGLSHPRTNTLFRNRWKRRRQLQRQTDGKGEELFK